MLCLTLTHTHTHTQVKLQFQDRKEVYDTFLEIMKEFKAQRWVVHTHTLARQQHRN